MRVLECQSGGSEEELDLIECDAIVDSENPYKERVTGWIYADGTYRLVSDVIGNRTTRQISITGRLSD